jgi:hypothetical protein
MHSLNEARSERDIVVLDEDPVALLDQHIRDLARHVGHRTASAQEKVEPFACRVRHRARPGRQL